MPLIAHTNLPTFERLREEGQAVLAPGFALHQDIRELHIGLLNMMPDAALAPTERQFFRLIGGSNQIAQFFVHPFTLDELPRGVAARNHIEHHYESFEQIREAGLDALIITGANVTQPHLPAEPFWEPLKKVLHWADENVASTLCSCLATHAVMEFRYGHKRRHLGFKRWGVFRHRVVERSHPLVANVNTVFDVPHSRYNQVDRRCFEQSGLAVLVESEPAGVHMAVSEDGFRVVFFQGHPEYDTISLLKEFQREVSLYLAGQRQDYPPFPDNFLRPRARAILDEYGERARAHRAGRGEKPILPERLITAGLDNTWRDSAEAVLDNWIGRVYQVTHQDRRIPFMDGVNRNDPLGYLASKARA